MLLKKKKSILNELLNDGRSRISKRIAIFGGSTTNDIALMLRLFLLDIGIDAEIYQSEYAQYWQDAMFPDAHLLEFKPDIVFVHTTSRNIKAFPTPTDSAEAVSQMLESQLSHFTQMWDNISRVFECPIIQNNFELPSYRLLGNSDASDIHGRTNFITRLNAGFYEYAQSHKNFYIHDIMYLSSTYGLDKWSDPMSWYLYKYAMVPFAIPEFAFSVACIIKSIYGLNKKALVLDMDNTLWGGVVGDDGVDGLVIGPETPQGQAYSEFQEYIKQHKDLGVVLAVNSKNDLNNALDGLAHHDCLLKKDDFAVIKANWQDKATNIREIAAELSLTPDSFVFVDDNPAERDIVQSTVAGIAVPDIGNVEDYIRVLDRGGYFETTSLSAEDASRAEQYRLNILRTSEMNAFTDYRDYLLNLEMLAVIKDFEPVYLARITQLTNKSNQFNLTTKRYNEAEMQKVAESSDHIRLYGRLTDKFGDNGIVSVVIGSINGEELSIDLWLMSCRVLKRNMEYAMLDTLVKKSREAGIKRLIGHYYPTAKNAMVKDLYADFGFALIKEFEDGGTKWALDLAGYENKNDVINVIEEEL